jgi:UDP-glucose 4-epimerase
VDANEQALTAGSGEMLNLGTGVGTSVNQIFGELRSILGFDGDPVYEAARPGEVQRIFLDAARAGQVLGWRPRVPFTAGLRLTVDWTRKTVAGP